MASVLAFDTYAYVKKLKDVGVPEPQAEVQVEALTALIEDRLASKQDLQLGLAALKQDLDLGLAALKQDLELEIAALKRDIKELETGLKRDMKEMETGLKRDMKEMEMRLLIRLGALLAFGIGAVATLIKLL